jgi:hypothetical protein
MAASRHCSLSARHISGCIFNPMYRLPGSGSPITAPARVDVCDGRFVLVFLEREVGVFVPAEFEFRESDAFTAHYLINYVTYRTTLNLQLVGKPQNPSLLDVLPTVDALAFRLDELTREELRGGTSDTHAVRVRFDLNSCEVVIRRTELSEYIERGDPTLDLAIAYFLAGCENRRYFLVEWYKSIDAIQKTLGGERYVAPVLSDFGLNVTMLKSLKRAANDDKDAYDIGRHAVNPDGLMRFVNFKYIFEHPPSWALWNESYYSVRNCIDSYFEYLRRQEPTAHRLRYT